MKIGDMSFRDSVLNVDIWYPPRSGASDDLERTPDHPVAVEVGLCDVRAADSIRIEYDFERDGYVIKQASTFSWPAGTVDHDWDWQEVAFIQAWGREKKDEADPA